MKTQTLNGIWNYRIGKGQFYPKNVPFSELAVGHFECTRNFDLQHQSKKVFLKFNGITYYAKVFLNEQYLGEMGPYCEYSFDITDIAKDKSNELLVELEDISVPFGPTAGWENFGGIIRDVELVYYEENYIEDVFFKSTLLNNYTDAEFSVETTLSKPSDNIKIQLFYKNKLAFEGDFSFDEKPSGSIKNVKLWSPEKPELYQLKVSLIKNKSVVDTYECNVGFREFKCDKHRFLLNGKPLFLKGVCKHEMFGDSGHCPTDEQMLYDMQMIKNTGCNFVRLVHYPHDKKIIDIADKLGLMVSEEPGLWWSDTSNPKVASGSLEVLRRTILRDRNHPSIVFWLCFNECFFTEQYLIDSANLCREYDSTRLVSGANCMSNEETLKYYNICNFDFYTMHPYSQTIDRAKESAKILNDKPLVFTEWGGHFVYDNPKLLGEFVDEMYKLYLADSDDGALAGAFFWEWSELNDYNRGRPACIDGNLCEGLVDGYRNPRLIFNAFCEAIKRTDTKTKDEFWIEYHTDGGFKDNILKPKANDDRFFAVIKTINNDENSSKKLRKRKLLSGPVLKNIDNLSLVPLVIGDNETAVLSCDITADCLSFYGMTSLTKGYPLGCKYGEEVAEVTVTFNDNSVQKTIFKNGVDITTAFCLNNSSRINPVAEKSKKLACFGYDKNFEQYVINEYALKFSDLKHIKQITVASKNNGYEMLLYGIGY